MDWQVLSGGNWSLLVNWLTNDVHNSTEGSWADWHHDGVSSVGDLLSSNETLGGVQSNGPDVVATQMLGNFEYESVVDSLHLEGVQNWGKISLELHVHDGTNNLGDFTSSNNFLREVSY